MIKKLFVICTILVIITVSVILGVAVYAKGKLEDYLAQPVKAETEQLITIDHGASLRTTLISLEQQGAIDTTPFSRLLPRLYPDLVHIKAGTYQVSSKENLQQLIQEMVAGDEYQFTITFIEGSRFSEWLQQLAQAKGLVHKIQDMTEADIAKALDIKQEKLEGLMLAETYHYTQGTSDLAILKRSHQALQKILDIEWVNRQKELPLKTPYEALILASIIEKETAIDSERERIASVFINRLNRKMRLQTDPTVIYGLGDKYDGNIRKKDLSTPTEYNTYVINGLPPTPIAMPGPASIKAVLNPESSHYLYFVASGDGGHVFSKNLTEHNRAVRKYLRKLRSK